MLELDDKRCNTCKHRECTKKYPPCNNCPMWKSADELGRIEPGCGCIAYDFDRWHNCPFYEKLEEQNGIE